MPQKLLLAMSLVTALAACASDNQRAPQTTSTQPAAGQRLASTATLRIVDPQPGAAVQGPTFVVRFELTGARIIPQATTDLRPDEGHMHVKLDGTLVTLLGSLEQRLEQVPVGSHVVEAEFVAGDHGPFNPRILQTVTFTVK